MLFLLFYVFFYVESESEVRFDRSPLFWSYKNNVLDRHEIQVINSIFVFYVYCILSCILCISDTLFL